jgi:LPS-assembly lipoprotein
MSRSNRLSRRAVLGSGLLTLSGCGFHPVYGPSGATAGAQDELAAIFVGLMPSRIGQLLRLALVDRFERGGVGVAQRYDLTVTFTMLSEALSIQVGNTSSRIRLTSTANWILTAQDTLRQTLKSGSARQVDGYNIFNNQPFAGDMEGDAVQRRMVEALADDIALQLAVYFNQRSARS